MTDQPREMTELTLFAVDAADTKIPRVMSPEEEARERELRLMTPDQRLQGFLK